MEDCEYTDSLMEQTEEQDQLAEKAAGRTHLSDILNSPKLVSPKEKERKRYEKKQTPKTPKTHKRQLTSKQKPTSTPSPSTIIKTNTNTKSRTPKDKTLPVIVLNLLNLLDSSTPTPAANPSKPAPHLPKPPPLKSITTVRFKDDTQKHQYFSQFLTTLEDTLKLQHETASRKCITRFEKAIRRHKTQRLRKNGYNSFSTITQGIETRIGNSIISLGNLRRAQPTHIANPRTLLKAISHKQLSTTP